MEPLDNMFTSVNEQVGTIAGQVGQTPQGWNAGIFNLIQNISQTVIVPIAGLIITFARQTTPGWDVWGNEIQSDIEMKSEEEIE